MDAAHVEADLHAYASRVTAEAAAIADGLSRARDEVLSGQRSIAEHMTSVLSSSLDDMAQKIGQGASTLSAALTLGAEESQAAVLSFKTKLDASSSAADKAAETSVAAYRELTSTANAVSTELETFHSALAFSRESVVVAFGAATEQMRRLAAELETSHGHSGGIDDAVQAIETGLRTVTNRVEALSDLAKTNQASLSQYAENAAAVQQDMVRQASIERAALEAKLADDRAGFAGNREPG